MAKSAKDSEDGGQGLGSGPPPLAGEELVKEVCRRIRLARSLWDAHNNAVCRGEREKALALYSTLSKEERERVPQTLRVWLRYRSEKYFGPDRTPPGSGRRMRRGPPASLPPSRAN